MTDTLKNIFLIALSCFMLVGCSDIDRTFTGYLVAKEYIPEHMSNETPKIHLEATFVPVPSTTMKPYKVEELYVWHIANKDRILHKIVTKEMFNSSKCGDKVAVYEEEG